MGDLPDGGAAAELRHSTPFPEPNPFEIRTENWATADRAAREIIQKVQPTSVSEERRREVVDYIQRLIRNCLGAEVFPYGSVPLKTYLPDGDIDLTTFGGPNIEDALVDDMKSVLEEEEKNVASEFVVKDVQLIRAEVKIVKCIVQDIVVDVSFNQIGGLCTLCFLEQVDRLIGKDHLFKRSIILIKAWCYYESRILGAHHGLISTYALETLVLYIFHLYHSTLDGPLAVLYKFLDYFSKFDWETYCVSINGPIRLSSLPAIIVEMPEDSDRDLLLSNDFLNSCVSMFSVPSRGGDKNSRGFQLKHLNVVDPLKEINNLGRSVSKGNFYRIRSAFSYGARKLATILLQPEASIANELYKFFPNTMARHGGGQRPDVQDFDPSLNPNGAGPCNNDSLCESSNEDAVSTGDLQSSSGKFSQDSPKRTERTPKPYHAPHHYFANSKPIDATAEDKNQDSDGCEKNNSSSEDSDRVDPDRGAGSRRESPELLSSPDLSGDYEAYLQCLHYGRWCYEYGLGMHSLHMPPMPNGQFQNNGRWEHPLPHPHFKQNGFSHRPHNGFHPSPPVYPMQPVLLPLGWEEVPKPRGTGYFPNTNQPPQAYRSPPMKGRSQAASRSPRNNNNGSNVVFTEPNMVADRSSSHEQSQPLINSPDKFSPRGNGYFNANGSFVSPEGVVELELSEKNNGQLQKSQPALTREQDRISLRSSYHLKDEDDFPPLPV